jgi:tagaturonate reductase
MLKHLDRQTTGIPQTKPVKVLQFGGGNFLRGFADWAIDVMNEKVNFKGAIDIVQSISADTTINAQDGLYHVVLRGIENGAQVSTTRLITAVNSSFSAADNYQAFLRAAENIHLEFVISNTTESGIVFDPKDSDPFSLPASFPGKVTTLLYHRFTHFNGAEDKGLTFIPCELIERNGEALRDIILQYCSHWNLPGNFKNWIQQSNTFCNTLVDRIVPGFPKDTAPELQQQTGYSDPLMVMAEPFHLWVIEAPDHVRHAFPGDKAGLEIKFTDNLTPYRTRKVRILNGAHTAMVPVAYLFGLRTVRDSIDDPLVGDFVRRAIEEEIIPTLDLSKEELFQFAAAVVERFRNPFIRHELASIALNSISKFNVRVLPSILQYFELKKQLPKRLVFSFAALIRFYKGEWKNEKLPVKDSAGVMEAFANGWKSASIEQVARNILSNTALWNTDLTKVPGLIELVVNYLTRWEKIESSTDKITIDLKN